MNTQLSSTTCSADNSSARTPLKTPSYVAKNACLLVRYLAMDIYEQHTKRLLRNWFYCCARVFQALPRNRTTCHNIMTIVRNKCHISCILKCNSEHNVTHICNLPFLYCNGSIMAEPLGSAERHLGKNVTDWALGTLSFLY
jgi:hypothetical protein